MPGHDPGSSCSGLVLTHLFVQYYSSSSPGVGGSPCHWSLSAVSPMSLSMRHTPLPMSALSRPGNDGRLSPGRPGEVTQAWSRHRSRPAQAGPVFTQRMCVKTGQSGTWPGPGTQPPLLPAPGSYRRSWTDLLLLHYNYYGVISNSDLRLNCILHNAYKQHTTSTNAEREDHKRTTRLLIINETNFI